MLRILPSAIRFNKSIHKSFVIQQFKLPDLGEKIKEATIKKWKVKEGDIVDEFDTVAEVATDKLFTEIPSPYKGKIHKLMYKEEEACNVGDVLLEIDTESSTNKQSEIAVDGEHVEISVATEQKNQPESIKRKRVLASPAVRALAKKHNINLEDVKLHDPNSIISKNDIHQFLESRKSQPTIEQKKAHKENKEISDHKTETKQKHEDKTDNKKLSKITNDQTPVKMKLFEQGMVKSMTHALTVPHFNLHDEYDLTQLESLRHSLKSQGHSITLFSIIVKAFSLAINSVPRMNASYYPEKNQYEYYLNSVHNISIAIDSPQGLAAPNIKNVQDMSIVDINKQIKELQKTTSEGKLTAHHLEGGTIALSNIGTISGSFAAPLNLPNQVCIVALGKLNIKPIYNKETKSFEPRNILPVSFGCDHRVLDGATVARFSLAWKNLLENPGLILTQLR